MNAFGEWQNTEEGYDLRKLRDESWCFFWSVAIYRCDMIQPAPLTLMYPNGLRLRTDATFETDGESIPPFLQSIPGLSDDRFLLSGLFHDRGRQVGGFWICEKGQTVYTFHRMSCREVDEVLYYGIGAEGGNACARNTIYRAVRGYAPFCKYPSIGYPGQTPLSQETLAKILNR